MKGDRRIWLDDNEYPELLRHIGNPPTCLNVRGRTIRKDLFSVAVVGSRNPTAYGRHMARIISGGLSASGVTVVSGLARGIDTEAHTAALEKNGRTIAVLGCGLGLDYPRGSGKLKERIAENGALLSEFEHDTPPLPHNFPSRNRIISGISVAVVIVQARERSGSLITARWALDQGREVMAVPGRVGDPLSAGPIALMRDGAVPVCSAKDVLSALGFEDIAEPVQTSGGDRKGTGAVTRALERGPCLPEDLVRITRLALQKVLSELTRLEVEGRVTRDSGGYFTLK